MQLLEEYKELIERDESDISRSWKYIQMLLYFSSVLSGYACCILFYLLQENVFEGNCPLWATCNLMSEEELMANGIPKAYGVDTHWWKYMIVQYKYEFVCNIYSLTCLSSCVFGIVWITLFFMCGKGGHSTWIYQAPWRIVFPTLSFNIIFMILSMFAHYNLDLGYKDLIKGVKNVASDIYHVYNVVVNTSECEIIKAFMDIQNANAHNMCNVVAYIESFSALMVWSWILGTVILILRITMINDFRYHRVRIYEVKQE